VVSRDFLKKIGEIAKPLFLKISENIDEKTSFRRLYELFSTKDFFSNKEFSNFTKLFGYELPQIIKETLETEEQIRDCINEYITTEYLDVSDLSQKEKESLLLKRFIIKPNTSWSSDDFSYMKIIHDKSDTEGYAGGEESFLNQLMNDEILKSELEEEFERFSEFYDISTGAGFGIKNKDKDKKIPLGDAKFLFIIFFDYSLILFYTFVILSKYGYLKKSIDNMIDDFIGKRFVPFVLHEVTHYIQKVKSAISSKSLINYQRYKSPNDIETEEEFKDWLIDYLSDPIEIGAHASEFVETLIANFPSKSYKELLDMFKRNEIPLSTSHALNKYNNSFMEIVKEKMLKGDPVINKFRKTVFKILQEYDEKSKD
jgi:hypothetical protein